MVPTSMAGTKKIVEVCAVLGSLSLWHGLYHPYPFVQRRGPWLSLSLSLTRAVPSLSFCSASRSLALSLSLSLTRAVPSLSFCSASRSLALSLFLSHELYQPCPFVHSRGPRLSLSLSLSFSHTSCTSLVLLFSVAVLGSLSLSDTSCTILALLFSVAVLGSLSLSHELYHPFSFVQRRGPRLSLCLSLSLSRAIPSLFFCSASRS